MKYVPYLIIAVLVSVAFIWYGNAQFTKGSLSCKLKQAEIVITETDKASKEKVKNDVKYKAMANPDLVKHGYGRGWLRAKDDR